MEGPLSTSADLGPEDATESKERHETWLGKVFSLIGIVEKLMCKYTSAWTFLFLGDGVG